MRQVNFFIYDGINFGSQLRELSTGCLLASHSKLFIELVLKVCIERRMLVSWIACIDLG